MLHEAYKLVKAHDRKRNLRRNTGFDRHLQSWIDHFIDDRTNPVRYPARNVRESRQETRSVNGLVQTAIMMHLNEALSQSAFEEVHERASRYAPFLTSSDQRASLLAAKAVAWERTRQFDKAFAAYEAIEAVQPDSLASTAGPHKDYSLIKAELADSMTAHNLFAAVLEPSELLPSLQPISQTLEVKSAYPNPFNPETLIPFQLSERSRVKIEIYNMLGQRVARLTDQIYDPGLHQVRFNATNMASGIYFIRAHISNQEFVRKITLIK